MSGKAIVKIFENIFLFYVKLTLRQKNSYSELFWSAFFPHFPAFQLNTERYSVNAGKKRTRIIPNTDTFYAVSYYRNKKRKISIKKNKTSEGSLIKTSHMLLWVISLGVTNSHLFLFLYLSGNIYTGL